MNAGAGPISFDFVILKLHYQKNLNSYRLLVIANWDTLSEIIEIFGSHCYLRFFLNSQKFSMC